MIKGVAPRQQGFNDLFLVILEFVEAEMFLEALCNQNRAARPAVFSFAFPFLGAVLPPS